MIYKTCFIAFWKKEGILPHPILKRGRKRGRHNSTVRVIMTGETNPYILIKDELIVTETILSDIFFCKLIYFENWRKVTFLGLSLCLIDVSSGDAWVYIGGGLGLLQ